MITGRHWQSVESPFALDEKKYFVLGDDDDKRHVYRATTGRSERKTHTIFSLHTQLSTTSFHPSSDAESFSETKMNFDIFDDPWSTRRCCADALHCCLSLSSQLSKAKDEDDTIYHDYINSQIPLSVAVARSKLCVMT